MKVGIVGFAGSGKTTVFNTLTGLKAEVGGYGGKDKANIGIIKVPDVRIEELAKIYKPKKKVFAEMNFVDVAGPQGEAVKSGLDTKLVAEMREADALVHVVRGFENPLIEQPADLLRDIKNFDIELILADLIPLENRLAKMKKEKANPREKEIIEQCKAALDEEKPLRSLDFSAEEWQMLAGFRFLSQKPVMLLINLSEDQIGQAIPLEVEQYAKDNGYKLITMCGRAEMDIAELPIEEQGEFLKDLGISEPARDRFIRSAYELLDLISFLTSGEDECRAWTIRRGTNAQRAAGKIHSDIERGFIRAEVVAYLDFIALGSEAKCRETGKLRLEGKEYIVHDGDIINFRFNV
ncbi:MAG: redox-regulated ATPase YchF [Blastocatellia bacterium]|nr:redox-regulated ATPase YchF [Blastocatellia bacterium]MBN8725756.1 redox-regulated ATPase YchF [Acidobacteriota bacterium]